MRTLVRLISPLFLFVCVFTLSAAELSRPRATPQAKSRPFASAIRTASGTRQQQPPLLLVDWLSPSTFAWPEDDLEFGQPNSDDEEPKTNYGPPPDEPRKTLFQWSYGTSFTGGVEPDDDLQTDRPDFVEASTTVGKGVLQIESGYTYVRNDDPDDDTISHSIGEVLFRYGVLEDWIELRLGVFPFSETTTATGSPTVHTSGVSHLYVGTKLALTPQEGLWPEMALTPQMTIPIHTDGGGASDVLPGVNWLYGWDVTDIIGVGASTQFNHATDGQTGHKYTEWSQAVTVNYNLAEKVGAYTEWFGLFPSGADTEQVQHYIDGGFTYRPTHDMQFDIRAGVGLTEASDDYFVGTGFSFRVK